MTFPTFLFEKRIHRKDYQYIIGVDEVGRGCLAGPVVVAAVVFPAIFYKTSGPLQFFLKDKLFTVDDSKRLTADKREILAREIKKVALSWDVTEISVGVIDRIGIARATMKGMRKTIKDICWKVEGKEKYINPSFWQGHLDGRVQNLNLKGSSGMDSGVVTYVSPQNDERKFPENLGKENPKNGGGVSPNNTRKWYVLVDYFNIPYLPKIGAKNQKGITKGDQRSVSIAAASIIAKVYLDGLMGRLAKKKNYRKYHWEKNKGYGTLDHTVAIKKYGLTKYHRKMFVRKMLTST